MNLKQLKQERTKQWANNRKVPRGWDRYRSTTFLEVVGAKVDRALQCADLIREAQESLTLLDQHLQLGYPTETQYDEAKQKKKELKKRIKKLEFDALDSSYDAKNYMDKLIDLIEKDKTFISNTRLP